VRSRSHMFSSSTQRTRRGSGRTALKWLGLVVGVLLLVGVVVAGGLWWYANSQFQEIDVPALDRPVIDEGATQDGQGEGEVAAAGEIEDTLNVLVVGNDTREGLTEEQLQELGTEDVGTQLTDTIMLVQISPRREQAVVVAFPRDLRVTLPGEGDVKINAVKALGGGPDALVEVVQDFSGIDLDHYVEVNMAGFLQLADVLDGVEVCLDEPLEDPYAGVDLPAGCQTLDSTDALGFVRSRRSETAQFGVGDFGRIAKQQYYLQQAMNEATQLGTLVNPIKVKSLIDAVASAVTTDRALGLTDMYRIANTLKGVTSDDVVMRTVPGTIQMIGDVSYVVHDAGPTTDLFAAMREGGPLGEAGTEAPSELQPEDVSILIVNGVGVEGLAGDVRSYLEERDFVVTDAVNPFDLDPDAEFDTALERLTIRHTPEGLPRAELLLDRLGDVPVDLEEVEPDQLPGDADLVLEVGGAWEDQG
jgi:LCP family protein required for cell wall assembly